MATLTLEEEVPVGHRDGPPLYGRMMKSIATGHDWANRIRMIKLPLIFTEPVLYAGAINQFYWLSATLEAALEKHKADPMVAEVRKMGLLVTPGYESDLAQLYGKAWREEAEKARTAATAEYCEILKTAEPVELVAASFILYGALVVGGGKMTQAKVRKVLPGCDHTLFDVAEDMKVARQTFKNTFTAIGKAFPEHFERLEQEAARFMSLNNGVILSVTCVGNRVAAVGLGVAVVVAVALRWAMTR